MFTGLWCIHNVRIPPPFAELAILRANFIILQRTLGLTLLFQIYTSEATDCFVTSPRTRFIILPRLYIIMMIA